MMDDKLYMFDGIVCICTTQEEDRWQKNCVPQFKNFRCLNRVIRFYGDLPEDKQNLDGCCFAHYNVLKLCKEKGFKMPLILESDFYFVTKNTDVSIMRLPMSLDLLGESVDSLQNVDWKLFFLGGKANNFYNKINNSLIKVSTELAHAYSVNYIYYDKVIETLGKKLTKTPDLIYSRAKYGNLYNYSYMTSRIIVEQRGGVKEDWRSSLARKKFKNKVYKHLK
jgi:hypothetical protein